MNTGWANLECRRAGVLLQYLSFTSKKILLNYVSSEGSFRALDIWCLEPYLPCCHFKDIAVIISSALQRKRTNSVSLLYIMFFTWKGSIFPSHAYKFSACKELHWAGYIENFVDPYLSLYLSLLIILSIKMKLNLWDLWNLLMSN